VTPRFATFALLVLLLTGLAFYAGTEWRAAAIHGNVGPGVMAAEGYVWEPLAAEAFLPLATPRAGPVIPSASLTARETDRTQLGVPQRAGLRPTASRGTPHSIRGIASWGPFSGHVVTRLPRGTPIVVTGPLGTWRGLSWGYGPQARTGRIADLDRGVFAAICGPPSRGICTVTLRY
jgi:hypothetical protein